MAVKTSDFPIGKGGQYLGGIVPSNYVCCRCNARGVKLWRRGQIEPELFCAQCAVTDQSGEIYGKRPLEFGLMIGWLVPAVPREDIDGWWYYTSIPGPGIDWWKNLPDFAK